MGASENGVLEEQQVPSDNRQLSNTGNLENSDKQLVENTINDSSIDVREELSTNKISAEDSVPNASESKTTRAENDVSPQCAPQKDSSNSTTNESSSADSTEEPAHTVAGSDLPAQSKEKDSQQKSSVAKGEESSANQADTNLPAKAAKPSRGMVNSSAYRGVSWDRSMHAWRTKINSVHLGYFDDEEEAARAYDEAALTLKNGDLNVELNFGVSAYYDNGVKKKWKPYKTKHGIAPRGSSCYRGVMWDKNSKAWRAKIKSNCKTIYLGVYSREIDAAKAYDKAAAQVHGDKAKFNFPNSEVARSSDPSSDLHPKRKKSKTGKESSKAVLAKELTPRGMSTQSHHEMVMKIKRDHGSLGSWRRKLTSDKSKVNTEDDISTVIANLSEKITGKGRESDSSGSSESDDDARSKKSKRTSNQRDHVSHQSRYDALSKEQLQRAIHKVNKLSQARRLASTFGQKPYQGSDSDGSASGTSDSSSDQGKKSSRKRKHRSATKKPKSSNTPVQHPTYPPQWQFYPPIPYMFSHYTIRVQNKDGENVSFPKPGTAHGLDSTEGLPGHLKHDAVSGGLIFVPSIQLPKSHIPQQQDAAAGQQSQTATALSGGGNNQPTVSVPPPHFLQQNQIHPGYAAAPPPPFMYYQGGMPMYGGMTAAMPPQHVKVMMPPMHMMQVQPNPAYPPASQ